MSHIFYIIYHVEGAELKRPFTSLCICNIDLINSQWKKIPFQRATLAGRGPQPMTGSPVER